METALQQQFALLAENVVSVKKDFKWDWESTKTLSAFFYTTQGKRADCDTIKNCEKLIKANTGIFSTIRGNLSLVIASRLALSPDPQQLLTNTLDAYNRLKKAKFHSSDYLVYAACTIAEEASVSDYDKVIERARVFYEGMKKAHWFITGQDDYLFAVTLGLRESSIEIGLANIENLYSELKKHFSSSNAVQALAQVLSLSTNIQESLNRVLKLRDAFREMKFKLDKSEILSTLGVLAMLPVSIETIVQVVTEGYNYLRKEKGFGAFSLDKNEVILFVCGIVSTYYLSDSSESIATISTNLITILLIQQITMYIIIFSASAAAASASN